MESALFSPITFRGLTLPNRIVVSPMCQYSAENGNAMDWHLMHLGQFSVSGAGLVMVEATAVEARGRITGGDLGLYSDENEKALERIVQFFRRYGRAHIGIQLAHAGRKASDQIPWFRTGRPLDRNEGAWETVAPSAIKFGPAWPTPVPLDLSMMNEIKKAFVKAAHRAVRLDFDLMEIHSAHGYLLHQFLSPLSNHRSDQYAGTLKNRIRFPLEVIAEIREVWPGEKPLGVRISATDYVKSGWGIDDSIAFVKELKSVGVDYIDVSGGGLVPEQTISLGLGYQVKFSERIRMEANIPTIAVGMINNPFQAEEIISGKKADLVALARGMLYNPRWAWHAAEALGAPAEYPPQYLRCRPSMWPQAFPKKDLKI